MNDPNLDPIFAYLREHSERYSYPALREQLLGSGHDQALVDRAIAIHQHENLRKAQKPVWLKALLLVPFNLLLAFLGPMILMHSNGKGDLTAYAGRAIGLILFLEVPAGLALTLSPGSRAWGRTLVRGFLLTAALVLLLVGFHGLWILIALGLQHGR